MDMPFCENNIKAVCVSNGIRVKDEEQKEFAMAQDKEPKRGDLIEISRALYQHWALYVGDGYVIHLTSASEHGSAGASSLMSAGQNKAIVKKEKLKKVVGRNKWCINNQLHMQLVPRRIQDIVQNANSLVGEEVPYNVTNFNCEHFVTLLRYRVPHSQQVENAVYATITFLISAAAAFGLAILRN